MTPEQKRLVSTLLGLRPFIVKRVAQRVPDYFVEDAVADTIAATVKVILADRFVVPEGVSEARALKSWLVGVLRRVCADTLRQDGARWLVRTEVKDTARVFSPIPVLEARDELRAVGRALTKWYRPVLARVARGETIAEIAAALGIPDGTVAERTRQARRVLKKRRNRER